MWDRLRTSSSPEEAFQGRHPGGSVHKHTVAQKRARAVRPGRTHHLLDAVDDNFPEPLDDLGIFHNTHSPNRFAIQRGKVVPRYHNVDIILPSQNASGSVHLDIVPPRRSSRRRQRQQQQQQQQSSQLQTNPAWRPASSVYDKSDGEPFKPAPKYKLESSTGLGGSAADQISPPSSPDVCATQDRLTAGDVSPIDDDLDDIQRTAFHGNSHDARYLPSQQQRTAIPKPSLSVQREDGGLVTQPREIRSASGRAWNDQVHTGRVLTPPDSDSFRHTRRPVMSTNSNTPLSPLENKNMNISSPSHGLQMRAPTKEKLQPLDNRPPWNGASGRSVIVEPVRDDLNVAPLGIPRKSSKRPGRNGRPLAAATGSGTSESFGAGSTMRKFFPLTAKHRTRKSISPPTQLSIERQPVTAENPYPSPPHSDFPTPEPRARHTPPPNWHNQALASHPPEPLPSSIKAFKRKPPPQSTQAISSLNFLPSNAKSSDGAGNLATPARPSPARPEETWVPPPSRFSITTYATSNPGTPRQSAEEDVPPLPIMPPASSSVNTGRPASGHRYRPTSSEGPSVVSMSSPYTTVGASQVRSDGYDATSQYHRSMSDMKSADRRASTLSMSKPLPPAPPELSLADDPVSQLNAQLNSLAHRRANIEKSIKQMTELMPQDNLLASDQVLRRREEEKQKVEGLREELAVVQSEEHKLGLQLFRAYKRQDKNAEYEPTTLWVRRVAG
ncbi:hypothetical protein MAC_07068 [Metarhizium acridum CQMa 102]|uniref:Uncharacterized protein n=1 Tax=Metarhizium acridum (strain CQMa 102) TaxID=655827 RepID=E9EB20_METAQ|nr:uncharacterized protein MAC_07068 [Metarhizium acridum CQMa 102]EFY86852.1 hypothetical protein MAC_07068 [Metarhizium acridum CQMa 102]